MVLQTDPQQDSGCAFGRPVPYANPFALSVQYACAHEAPAIGHQAPLLLERAVAATQRYVSESYSPFTNNYNKDSINSTLLHLRSALESGYGNRFKTKVPIISIKSSLTARSIV